MKRTKIRRGFVRGRIPGCSKSQRLRPLRRRRRPKSRLPPPLADAYPGSARWACLTFCAGRPSFESSTAQLHGSSLQRTLPHVVSMSSRLPDQHQAELSMLDYGSPARRSSSGRRIGQLELRDGHGGGGQRQTIEDDRSIIGVVAFPPVASPQQSHLQYWTHAHRSPPPMCAHHQLHQSHQPYAPIREPRQPTCS
jgi:hypothetical protein